VCVSVCLRVRTITFERNDLWPKYLVRCFVRALSKSSTRSYFKVQVQMFILAKVKEWNWENHFRQRGEKADVKFKLQHQPQSGRCNFEWGLSGFVNTKKGVFYLCKNSHKNCVLNDVFGDFFCKTLSFREIMEFICKVIKWEVTTVRHQTLLTGVLLRGSWRWADCSVFGRMVVE